MTKRWATLAWLVAVTLLCAGDAAAERVWYIYLHGSALQFGFSRAGPYYSLSECQSMARKMGLAVDCTREEDAGPTPEDLALMQQQAVDAQRRQEQYLAEQRRLEAERERLRQVSYYNSQGNDMLNGGRYDEAIRAYEIALGYGQDPVVAGNLSLARYKRAFGDGHKYFADQQWDLAIGAYSLALTYRPDDRAAEANIQAAGAWKHYEQEKAQRRAMLEAAFGNMQSAINAHAEVAEVDRAAFLNEREAK